MQPHRADAQVKLPLPLGEGRGEGDFKWRFALPHDLSKAIEAHFTAHDNDGDFVSSNPETPYKFWPSPIGGRLVYSTKPDAARRIFSESFGLIARYGLPSPADADWLRRLAGRPRILFLGDLDPQDLMIFAWLRAHFGPRRIDYFGIGDWLLDERAIVVPDSYWIKNTVLAVPSGDRYRC